MGLPLKNDSTDFTSLLRRYQGGDEQALDALIPIVYAQLKKIATNQMRSQAASHTLCPTALVHEVFMKLKDAENLAVTDRAHFFAVAARTMRWLLTDYARSKMSEKRGGDKPLRIVFDENLHADNQGVEYSILDSALTELETEHPRLFKIVELRYLVGLTIEETAKILNVSPMTVNRDWKRAKSWLARQMSQSSK